MMNKQLLEKRKSPKLFQGLATGSYVDVADTCLSVFVFLSLFCIVSCHCWCGVFQRHPHPMAHWGVSSVTENGREVSGVPETVTVPWDVSKCCEWTPADQKSCQCSVDQLISLGLPSIYRTMRIPFTKFWMRITCRFQRAWPFQVRWNPPPRHFRGSWDMGHVSKGMLSDDATPAKDASVTNCKHRTTMPRKDTTLSIRRMVPFLFYHLCIQGSVHAWIHGYRSAGRCTHGALLCTQDGNIDFSRKREYFFHTKIKWLFFICCGLPQSMPSENGDRRFCWPLGHKWPNDYQSVQAEEQKTEKTKL